MVRTIWALPPYSLVRASEELLWFDGLSIVGYWGVLGRMPLSENLWEISQSFALHTGLRHEIRGLVDLGVLEVDESPLFAIQPPAFPCFRPFREQL